MTQSSSAPFPASASLGQRLRAAVRELLPRRNPVVEHFRRPYAERVAETKRLYSHEVKRQQLGAWLDRDLEHIKREHRENPRFYIDVVSGYAHAMGASSVMQLGAYVMTECQNLALDGFPGRLIASDYDPEHLKYLQNGFPTAPFDRIEYRVVDLEAAKPSDLTDVDMVAGLAVLSNIQPEGMRKFFAALEASAVRCVVISDLYVKDSLTTHRDAMDRSIPLPNSRNWCHPYQALARGHGFRSIFLPDFTYSSFVEARGTFIAHRRLADQIHADAMALAMRRYVARQDDIWAAYAALDLDRPLVTQIQAKQG